MALAEERCLEVGENFKISQLVDFIAKDPKDDEAVVKYMLQIITEERASKEKAKQLADEKEKAEKQQRFELEKLQF